MALILKKLMDCKEECTSSLMHVIQWLSHFLFSGSQMAALGTDGAARK